MRYRGLPDDQILAAMQAGGSVDVADGFRELVSRYKDRIVNHLIRSVGDRATAEDLAQEAFLRVYRNLRNYDPRSRFSTWFFTIATNLAKDEFKRRARHPSRSVDWTSGTKSETTRTVPSALADDREDPERAAERSEVRDLIQRTLGRLKPEDREVLLLRETQGLLYEEIAQILQLPLGTVKSRISRARHAFVAVWEEMVRT